MQKKKKNKISYIYKKRNLMQLQKEISMEKKI